MRTKLFEMIHVMLSGVDRKLKLEMSQSSHPMAVDS